MITPERLAYLRTRPEHLGEDELLELVTAYEAAREFAECNSTADRNAVYNRLIACFEEPTK